MHSTARAPNVLGDECRRTRRDVAQDAHDVDRRIVVERRRVVISALERVDLRPTAVRELRMVEIVERAHERGAGRRISPGRGVVGEREEPQLRRGRLVVDRRDVLPVLVLGEEALSGHARVPSEVDVLRPATRWSLERENDVGHPASRVAPEPRRGHRRAHAKRLFRVRRACHVPPAKGVELTVDQRLVAFLLALRPLEVLHPRIALGRRQRTNATSAEHAARVALAGRTGGLRRLVGLCAHGGRHCARAEHQQQGRPPADRYHHRAATAGSSARARRGASR